MSRVWQIERAQGARNISLLSGRAPGFEAEPSLQDRLADAYRAGADDMRDELEAQIALDRQRLAQLASAIEGLTPEPCEALSGAIVDAVLRLVRDIVGDAPVDAALLRERALSLASAVDGETGRRAIRANPADLDLLAGLEIADIIADSAVARGNLRMIEGDSIFEDGVASALHRLRAAIDEAGLAA